MKNEVYEDSIVYHISTKACSAPEAEKVNTNVPEFQNVPYYWRHLRPYPNTQIQRCECGADSVRGIHSTWCPKYEEVIK